MKISIINTTHLTKMAWRKMTNLCRECGEEIELVLCKQCVRSNDDLDGIFEHRTHVKFSREAFEKNKIKLDCVVEMDGKYYDVVSIFSNIEDIQVGLRLRHFIKIIV